MGEQNQEGPEQDPPKGSLEELYEKLSRGLRENLEHAGTVTEEAFERALQDSKDWVGRMREHYQEDINRVSEFVRRDWLNAIQHSAGQTRRTLDLNRIQAGVLGYVSRLAISAGNQLEHFANRINQRLTYKTGEIAGAGTLVCTNCGQGVSVEKPTRIPPCPKCHHTMFRRSF